MLRRLLVETDQFMPKPDLDHNLEDSSRTTHMASDNVTILPTADCRTVDTQETKHEPTQLCMMMTKAAQDPVTAIDRTLQYANNPTEYLKQTLGEANFEERRSKLCIPDKIDRDVRPADLPHTHLLHAH